jgi:Protein of unknown function (DUF3606)
MHTRIDTNDANELRNWSKSIGASPAQIKAAVVGYIEVIARNSHHRRMRRICGDRGRYERFYRAHL